MKNKTIIKGNLLAANPAILGDDFFSRTVILLAEHSNTGSVGFVLNKPLDFSLNDLIPELQQGFTIYNGGPVEQDNLYFIHKTPELIPNSIEIAEGIYWAGNFDVVCELINSKKISDKDIRFFLGYTGWGDTQLSEELEDNSWIVLKNNNKSKLIEKKYNVSFWSEKMMELGDDYAIYSNAPENPILN